MQVRRLAFEVVLEAHKRQEDVLNAQPVSVQEQLGRLANAWELYPVQALSSVQTGASSLVQDNLGEQLHQVLSRSSLSTQEAPRTALAIWSEITVALNGLYKNNLNIKTSRARHSSTFAR